MVSKLLFQGVTTDSHLSAVRHVLELGNPSTILFSTAFMTSRGLKQIRSELLPVAASTTIIVGIRNGITTSQGLMTALDYGCKLLVVDTGSRNVIFHPKFYFSRNSEEARLVLGSANLTVGGLNSNIEASVTMALMLSNPDDASLISSVQDKIADMVNEYPDHVLEIEDYAAIELLLEAGRVADERVSRAPSPSGTSSDRDLDTIPKMKLKTSPTPEQTSTKKGGSPTSVHEATIGASNVAKVDKTSHLLLVWESSPLSRRYLTIPNGANTNPTGSMLFTKGAMDNIDQRHYFRDNVFYGLDWLFETKPGKEHLERAYGNFRLIIRNVDYGQFLLKLTHNTLTNVRAYAQRNSMTQLHWGIARPLVARSDLLNRIIYLYRDEKDPESFLLEID